jgi:ATP-binding protein involved in chromosome partitioning
VAISVENLNEDQIVSSLKTVQDPEIGKDLISLNMIKDLSVGERSISLTLELTTPACPLKDRLAADVRAAVGKVAEGVPVEISFSASVPQARGLRVVGGSTETLLPGVKNAILIASGKGGVGKSTVATNVACALAEFGARTGLFDADIYGPSLPTMLGMTERPQSSDGRTLDPVEVRGLRTMSIGYLVDLSTAMIWRGPMVHGAVNQFLRDVNWGDLDYLIIDLPPGTGDVQLTLSQKIKPVGAVLISTPQDVALADVVRGKGMFDTVEIPTLGVVENMSYFICPSCAARHEIFSSGGARRMADKLGIPFLGAIPIEVGIREAGDAGLPIVWRDPGAPSALAFKALASQIAAAVSVRRLGGKLGPLPEILLGAAR